MKIDRKKYPIYFFIFGIAYIPALISGAVFLLAPTAEFYFTTDFWLAFLLAILPIIGLIYYVNSRKESNDRYVVATAFIISLAFLYYSLFATLGF